ncbi:hypothetical protein GH714_005065 [Hevea brasiliensis]|uniref:HMG box domain-containing protein n=1 Tax=Hevea brasiliensis TaxID=3981 RepID=A0A6A6LZD3_HEVBR|nr:hypothetical protein GH714_005065 [Hevea brasiliensis]
MKLKRRPKKKSVKIDTKRPKKPPTAFFFFFIALVELVPVSSSLLLTGEDFQEQNPDVKSMRDIGKACGEKWKTMSYEDKVKYYDIAMEKRAVFDKAMANILRKGQKGTLDLLCIIKKREKGENEETEDDSEFDE